MFVVWPIRVDWSWTSFAPFTTTTTDTDDACHSFVTLVRRLYFAAAAAALSCPWLATIHRSDDVGATTRGDIITQAAVVISVWGTQSLIHSASLDGRHTYIYQDHFSRQSFIRIPGLREVAVKIASKFYDSIFSYDLAIIISGEPTQVASNKNYYVTTLRSQAAAVGLGDGWLLGPTKQPTNQPTNGIDECKGPRGEWRRPSSSPSTRPTDRQNPFEWMAVCQGRLRDQIG